MPLPTPNTNENKDDFMQRCILDASMLAEFPDRDQRIAVCENQYESTKNLDIKDNKMEEKKEKSFTELYKEYKEKGGNKPTLDLSCKLYLDKKSYRAVLTKEVMDRDGEVVKVNGLEVFNPEAGIPLVDNHDSMGSVIEKILGRIINLTKEKDQWTGDVVFANSPRAKIAQEMVDTGFIQDLSIGMLVELYDPMEKSIEKAELVEASLVIIPSNREAKFEKSANTENNEAKKMIDKLEDYEVIREKLKQVRKTFLSTKFCKSIGYEKTGNEVFDLDQIFDILSVDVVEKSKVETPQDKKAEPQVVTPQTKAVNTITQEQINQMVISAITKLI